MGGSKYREERMIALRKEISEGKYDLYLLQELWEDDSYNEIKLGVPANFSITRFRVGSLSSTCKVEGCRSI